MIHLRNYFLYTFTLVILIHIFAWRIDIDADGQIDYNEILHELTDDIVQVIEDVGHITVPEKLADLRHQREKKFKQLNISLNEGGHVTNATTTAPALPPSLMDYLKDTFNEVDVDKSGSLNYQELNNILHTVLANSDGDKELLNIEWDADKDGTVSWEEAKKAFTDIFNKYINSKNDYWVSNLSISFLFTTYARIIVPFPSSFRLLLWISRTVLFFGTMFVMKTGMSI